MQLTRITKENLAYFRLYLPPGRITAEQEAIGLVKEDGFPCAAALISGMYGEAALDWIFVHPKYRRQGAGSEFLEKIQEILEGETETLTVSYPAKAEGMDDFFCKNGFLLTKGDAVYTVPLAAFRKEPEAAALKKMAEKENACAVSSLNQKEKTAFLIFLNDRFGGRADLFQCDPALSFGAFDSEGRVMAAVLIKKMPETKTLFISALAGRGKSASWIVLGKALRSVERKKVFADYQLRFVSGSKGIDRIGERISERIKETDVRQIRYAVKVF